MAARSIASLSLTFGLVSIPIKLYSATESSSAVKFKLMGPSGARVRQTYVTDALPDAYEPDPQPERASEPSRPNASARAGNDRVVDLPLAREASIVPNTAPEPELEIEAPIARREMVKGYEFQKGQFVLFTREELKSLEERSRQTIDIVSFIPKDTVDPLYFDKPYFLAPDKRGGKPYSLLMRAMQDTGRCALAKWAWRSKEYVVQVRAAESGLVLQQLLYADEVRSIKALEIDLVAVSDAELALAKQIIEQISAEAYDPAEFVDEEKQRILEAVERKIAGKEIIMHEHLGTAVTGGGEVVDLMAALRASLAPPKPATSGPVLEGKRKPARRASTSPTTAASPARKRAER